MNTETYIFTSTNFSETVAGHELKNSHSAMQAHINQVMAGKTILNTTTTSCYYEKYIHPVLTVTITCEKSFLDDFPEETQWKILASLSGFNSLTGKKNIKETEYHSNWWHADTYYQQENWPMVVKYWWSFYNNPALNSNNKSGFEGDLGGAFSEIVTLFRNMGIKRYVCLSYLYTKTNDPQILVMYRDAVAQGLIKPDSAIPPEKTTTIIKPPHKTPGMKKSYLESILTVIGIAVIVLLFGFILYRTFH